MAITNIPATFRRQPYESPMQRQMPQLIMNMMMMAIKMKSDKKKTQEIKEWDQEKLQRETTHDLALADKRQQAQRDAKTEQRRFELLKEGYTETDPSTQEPDFKTSPGGLMVGDKYYSRPEDPMIRVAPIPNSTSKLMTWRQNGQTSARIIEGKDVSQWSRKYDYYRNLAAKKLISDAEFKKGVGIYVEEKTIPMFQRMQGGTRTLEIPPDEVEKFKSLGFETGAWKPDKVTTLNTLLRQGENIIAKGMGMDVALMDKYDVNRQREYFDKIKKYHRILQQKPELQTEMGVRKAADMAIKMGQPNLPASIKKTSDAVKYLMDSHFMTETEAIAWLKTNIR